MPGVMFLSGRCTTAISYPIMEGTSRSSLGREVTLVYLSYTFSGGSWEEKVSCLPRLLLFRNIIPEHKILPYICCLAFSEHAFEGGPTACKRWPFR